MKNNKSSKWIKLSEKLPKDSQEVLVKTKYGKIYNAIYMDDMGLKGWLIECNNLSFRTGQPYYWKNID